MMKASRAWAIALVFFPMLVPLPASADACGSDGGAIEDSFTVELTCSHQPTLDGEDHPPSSSSEVEVTFTEYSWHSPCINFSPSHSPVSAPDCGIARGCPEVDERSWQLWGLSAATDAWEYITSQCFGRPPTVADTPRPQVTPGLVLNAIRRIGLPELTAQTQPADKTLVNFATIFFAEPETFTRTLTLLGQQVDVEATPSQFTWHYGDGTSQTTTSPGAPYPSKEITYSYTDAHTTVTPSVDVTYSARFRVNDGAWQDIGEMVTIAGPASNLRISEATAVLSGNYG